MKLQRILVCSAIAMLATTTVARAQTTRFPADVERGQRVRVWLPESYMQMNGPWHRQQLRGTIEELGADTLRVSVPGTVGTLSIPRVSIKRLELSLGRPNRIVSMFERGVGGAIASGIVFAATNAIYRQYGTTQYDSNWDAALTGAAWGGAIGGAVGLVIPNERWRRVRLRR